MIKRLLFSTGLLLSVSAGAQITLNSTDFPVGGDSTLTSLALTSGVAVPTLTGANVNWDYSTLAPDIQRYEKFDSPYTFTSPFNLLFSSFNCTYGRDNYTLTSIPVPTVTLESAYDFFKKSTVCLRQTGSGYTINSIPIPFLYSKPDTIHRFPMDYLNTDSCNFKFALPPVAALPIYYGQTGHRVNTVDGWGTITTPYGSFPVLRVKSTISATDTVYVDTLGFGFNVARPLRTEYKWLAVNMDVPILQINTTMVGSTETVSDVTYIDSVRAGVPQVGITESAMSQSLSVYPNPANEQINVQYTLSGNTKATITVMNALGQSLIAETENATAGDNKMVLNTQALSPGVYLLRIEAGNYSAFKKIVIAR